MKRSGESEELDLEEGIENDEGRESYAENLPASRRWYEVTALSVADWLWQTCCLHVGQQVGPLSFFVVFWGYLFIDWLICPFFSSFLVSPIFSLCRSVFLTTLISLLHYLERICFSNGLSQVINRTSVMSCTVSDWIWISVVFCISVILRRESLNP